MFVNCAVGGSKARPEGWLSPEAKVLLAATGVNLKIVPLAWSASNRLPEASNASPVGVFNPDAKVLLTPAAVNLMIVPLPVSDSNKMPPPKTTPNGPSNPPGEVGLTPAGGDFWNILATRSAS